MTSDRIGSHHCASPRYRRSGIPTGAENGTYDITVSTTGLSLKKITRKYGAMMSIVSGAVVEPMSSIRETSEPAAANSDARSTNPKRKKIANQAIGAPRPWRTSLCPVTIRPTTAIVASSKICAIAKMVFPMILPAKSVRAGIADRSSSTTRVCFSSTTLWAMVPPNKDAASRKTTPNPIETKYRRAKSTVAGSSSLTDGDSDRPISSDVGGESSAMTTKPVGEEASSTTAALTSPLRTSASAASWSATCVTSTPGTFSTAAAVEEVTATLVADGLPAENPPQMTAASAISRVMTVEITKARLRSLEPTSRSATSQTFWKPRGVDVEAAVFTG